ncbi:MAG: helix-turn-helix domain-containing protein [Sphingomicrobium sp.]
MTIAISPDQWLEKLSGPPDFSSDKNWQGALLRSWKDTSPTMLQPPLACHYAVLHLGGSKRVHRRGEGGNETTDVQLAAVTVVPAGSAYTWHTEGPVEFAHLYINQAHVDRAAIEWFDRDPLCLDLESVVGLADPLLSGVFGHMLSEAKQPGFACGPTLDSLYDAFIVRMIAKCSNLQVKTRHVRHALAPYRLRRVLEHLEAHLADDIDLAEMASVAGLSRYHFSRGFARAMGLPPGAYLASRRIERAKKLLRDSELSISEIALQSGFAKHSTFSAAFHRGTGMTPSAYRYQ